MCNLATSLRDSSECTNTETKSTDRTSNFTDERCCWNQHFNRSVKKTSRGTSGKILHRVSDFLPVLGKLKPVKPAWLAVQWSWPIWIYVTSPKIPRSVSPMTIYLHLLSVHSTTKDSLTLSTGNVFIFSKAQANTNNSTVKRKVWFTLIREMRKNKCNLYLSMCCSEYD